MDEVLPGSAAAAPVELIEMSLSKQRKVDTEGQIFQDRWKEKGGSRRQSRVSYLFSTSGCSKGVQHQTTLRDPHREIRRVHRATSDPQS